MWEPGFKRVFDAVFEGFRCVSGQGAPRDVDAGGGAEAFRNSRPRMCWWNTAAFAAHQWLDAAHPDEGQQLRVLQDVLHAMSLGAISPDAVAATVMPSAKGVPASELWSSPLFFWYDYFSCLELEKSRSETNDQSKAID